MTATSMLINRRNVLKSAGALLGASALNLGAPNTLAQGRGSEKRGAGSLRDKLVGFMLGHEQFTVPRLVEIGVAAEQAGFDLLANSDHFQPWQSNEGHSGEAWITMGVLGQRTHRLEREICALW